MEHDHSPIVTPPEIPPAQRRCLKLGSVLSAFVIAITIISALMCLATILVPVVHGLAVVLALLALVLITIFTLGLIFLIEDNIAVKLWQFVQNSNTDSVGAFATNCFHIMPYVATAGVGLSIISLIFLFASKQKCAGRKALAMIFGILCCAMLVIYFFFRGTTIS